MSDIKKSLEDNLEFIRSKLPENLKAQAENCLKETPLPPLSQKEVVQEIVKALPDDIKAGFEKDPVIPESPPVPTLAEQKAAVLEALPKEFIGDFEAGVDNELIDK
ncbi:Uncharacterised protein [BD1-7 clade bacterium]|uniref:Uncharacterized protein n=1 Tax=BD1-7 clade bacterium TaxID=2029982 RepID=A0A5S9PJV5_9GAMM|nr:Uncharacterised protein [BD1-7 clade bacterium]